MRRRQTYVRLKRKHVVHALVVASLTALAWLIGDIIEHGLRTSTWLWAGCYLGFNIVGMTWANWSGENSDERNWREELRPLRVHATRAKVR